MEPIKISQTADSLSGVYFNGESLNAVVFNGQVIWPATISPTVNIYIDDVGDIDYPTFDDLLD